MMKSEIQNTKQEYNMRSWKHKTTIRHKNAHAESEVFQLIYEEKIPTIISDPMVRA